MEPTSVLAFAAVALTLVVVPGPDWAYVLASGLRERVVAPAVTGILLGYVLITAVVAAGVGSLVTTVPFALAALTLAGAAYLLHLGIGVVRDPGTVEADVARPPGTLLSYLWRGAGVSALNPKGLLLFLAILPQFASPAARWPMPVQLAALGLVFIALCACVYSALGHAANRILAARPGLARVTSRVAGVAMIVVAVLLVAEQALRLA